MSSMLYITAEPVDRAPEIQRVDLSSVRRKASDDPAEHRISDRRTPAAGRSASRITGTDMLFMVIERFRGGDAEPVYRRFRERGRLTPEGLTYVDSWVDDSLRMCFQLMRTDRRDLLDEWMSQWSDLVEFEVYPVVTSREAASRVL